MGVKGGKSEKKNRWRGGRERKKGRWNREDDKRWGREKGMGERGTHVLEAQRSFCLIAKKVLPSGSRDRLGGEGVLYLVIFLLS